MSLREKVWLFDKHTNLQEAQMHGNARLTLWGRQELVRRIAAGRPIAHVASEMGISRPTAHKWWRRWQAEGDTGLRDHSSRPHNCPGRSSRPLEAKVERLRRRLKIGPVRIAARLEIPASTAYRILCRLGLNRLSWMDRPTGRVIRRYERSRPGELVHLDVKKLGRIPEGGGWRVLGRQAGKKNNHGHGSKRVGYAYIHSAVDDHSRLAYSEVLADETKQTASEFWRRANAFFAEHGIDVAEVLTDNGACYRSKDFAVALGPVLHRFTRPYRPQTNGKVERFNRTLLEEWGYVRPYRSEALRVRAFEHWLHTYNYHRHHTAIGGPPISRVNDLVAHYS